MAKLPRMIYGSGKRERLQVAFGGYRHTESCGDGEFYDMQNMSCEHYPVLSTRRRRSVMREFEGTVNAFFAKDGEFITVEDGSLKYNGEEIRWVGREGIAREMIRFGDRVILLPDMLVIDKNGNCEPMETAVRLNVETVHTTYDVVVGDGTLYNQPAKANTIRISNRGVVDFREYFKAGDCVTISGMTVMPKNNKSAIIREVEELELHFSEFCFELDTSQSQELYYEMGSIRIGRDIPSMDGCFCHDNRLWGFKGSEIFASKLGDPFNFYVYDGLSTDSYYLDTQCQGNYIAGISFGGYPMFFREHGFLKIYGSKPSTYQTQDTQAPGVKKDSPKSLCSVGGSLVYLSNEGFMMYDGSLRSLSNVFGLEWYENAVSGADGRKCYISCNNPDGSQHLFCYDSEIGLFMREDSTKIVDFSCDGVLFALAEENGKYKIISMREDSPETPGCENDFDSFVEFGDQVEDSVSRKTLMKITLRLQNESRREIFVKIRYDGDKWETVASILGDMGKETVQLCIKPRRCDHYRIRIESSGDWKLYAMEKEYYIGSSIH